MTEDALAELAPTGVLRAAINMGNPLLVTGRNSAGDPEGVAADMAREIANRLGVDVTYVPFKSPGELADAAGDNLWDIGLIGAEPSRAKTIAFTKAYVEIDATYLVPAGSPFTSVEDVDRDGVRIAVSGRSAYDLYLTRSLKHAELVRVTGIDASFDLFVSDKLDALAGLRPALNAAAPKLDGSRVMDGKYTTVQQAIGCKLGNDVAAAYLFTFVEDAKASGLVAGLVEKHGVVGRLSVAPPA
ncbi:MAG: transporter substrate-binding domain-containing protein [Rhodospirillales bacterium]|nr:transporter substrate-binding domain-containing protein [Rhodospirillales bacterium]